MSDYRKRSNTTITNAYSGPDNSTRVIASLKSLNGIEGVPYQFMESVDRRIDGLEIGRKYADKIVSRIPLLFLTPCAPAFAGDFSKGEKNTIASALLGNSTDALDLIDTVGRYYTLEQEYKSYYNYLNTMLTIVTTYLGIRDENIIINGKRKKISSVLWQDEVNNDFFTTFASPKEMLYFIWMD